MWRQCSLSARSGCSGSCSLSSLFAPTETFGATIFSSLDRAGTDTLEPSEIAYVCVGANELGKQLDVHFLSRSGMRGDYSFSVPSFGLHNDTTLQHLLEPTDEQIAIYAASGALG